MKIKYAKFIKSSPKVADCPKTGTFDEIAVTGRSNVGKSTFINMLLDRKRLAKTSATPGKTKLINHFMVNDSWYFVDLPGYGYAKTGKKEREQLANIINEYIKTRENLQCILVLVDISINPQPIDLNIIEQLGVKGIPFALIFTKSDKVARNKLHHHIETYKNLLLERFETLPYWFTVSGVKRTGKEELLTFIDKVLNKNLAKN